MLKPIANVFRLLLCLSLLSACAEIKEAGSSIGHNSLEMINALGRGVKKAATSVTEEAPHSSQQFEKTAQRRQYKCPDK